MAHAEIPVTNAARFDWSRLAASPWAMAVAVALLLAATVCISLQRTFLGTGVETDFSSLFAQETLRILRGEPLQIHYHPPGFAFVLALGRLLHDGSWLATGLWISGLSTAVALSASVVAWRKLAGTAAAWGAIFACATSMAFRTSESEASSDMFFTALVCLLILLIVRTLQSPHRLVLWVACGAMAAFVFLTRTNGLLAAAVLGMPFLVARGEGGRGRNLAAIAIAFLLPNAVWSLYAHATGSPIMPVQNYLNLAVTAYGDGIGKWGEQMNRLAPIMQNMTDVLLYDPPRLVARLATNLAALPIHIARRLVWLPMSLLAVPGLVLLLWKRRTPALLWCLGILFGMTALSGLALFTPRFYLMLVPAIGAMAGTALAAGLDRLALRDLPRTVVTAVVVLVCCAIGIGTQAQVFRQIETGPVAEFAEAAARLQSLAERDAVVYARSSSMVLESRRDLLNLNSFEDADSLRRAVCERGGRPRPSYLYIGTLEREYRVEFVRDLEAQAPAWLEPIARGTTADWTLYRIHLDQSNAASCSSSSVT